MNEDVLKMIDTLHARLDDVREAVVALPKEAPEYAKRLDKIDDSLYMLQVEIEKAAAAGEAATEVASTDESTSTPSANADAPADAEAAVSSDTAPKTAAEGEAAAAKSGEKKEILTDEMKDNLADAGRAIGNVLRDSKDVVSELSGTMNDLKDVFSFGKKR